MGAKEFKSITEADLAAFRKKHGKKWLWALVNEFNFLKQ